MGPVNKISAITLGHYDRHADAFFEGTRRHDVSQNIAALLAGVVEEHVNYSAACLYEGGEEIWRVWHQLDFGDFHLEVEGAPPEPFEAIKAKHFKRREEEGHDAVFSVPVELAAGLCGYAYGQAGDFTCLVEADE